MITENNNLEFKMELTDAIVKEIIAFCNTAGGTIILGYDDNGIITHNGKRKRIFIYN